MINDFQARLTNAKRFGNLTVTDLAAWFGVKRPSVHKWLKGANPREGKEELLNHYLTNLELLFPLGKLPVSLGVSRDAHLPLILALREKYAPLKNIKDDLTPRRDKAVVRNKG